MATDPYILPAQIPGVAGCCPCDSPDPCSCGQTCALSCRIVNSSGSGSFCGFPELAMVSTPPLYYHLMTLGGTVTGKTNINNTGCGPTGMYCNWSGTVGGQNAVSATDCSTTTGGTYGQTGCATIGCEVNTAGVETVLQLVELVGSKGPLLCTYFGGLTANATQTRIDFTNDNTCHTNSGGFVGTEILSCSAFEQLSVQDTAEMAIKRAVGPNPVYGAPQLCGPTVLSRTVINQNPSGPDFVYAATLAQTRVQLLTAVKGNHYTVTIQLGERSAGSSGPFIPFGLIEISLTAEPDVNGQYFTGWQDIPLEENAEVMPTSCSVVLTP